MLNPAGTLSFAVGNLSAAAGSGGGATGASLAAASLSGRPIKGEPGGSGVAPVVAGAADCWALAPNVNTAIKAPASKTLRGANEPIIINSSLFGSLRSFRRRFAGKGWLSWEAV